MNRYVKTNWIDKSTPINADRLNKIENQLELLTDALLQAESTPDKPETDSSECVTSITINGVEYKQVNGNIEIPDLNQTTVGVLAPLNPQKDGIWIELSY